MISTFLAEDILSEQKSDIFIAGLVHDIGKVAILPSILITAS
ncbi:MAG: hypothetical protein GY777_12620 [Candidatus Brocadiaceae bacterium]|nr:hypothetical protein [Candidatus Brocadiaceae bacterium]